MKQGELLDAAETVLASNAVGGTWPRAAALLARQSIEASLESVWRARAPGVTNCSVHAQLLLLPGYLSNDIARSAAYAWSALTRACHHHAYELAPTLPELRALIQLARELAIVVPDP